MSVRVQQQADETVKLFIKKEMTMLRTLEILKSKGYKIVSYSFGYEDDTFPGGKTAGTIHTFCAIKPNEEPSISNCYDTVFEKEIEKSLKYLFEA